jgi:APA family basic amino acid/polyamine antiporter
MIASYSMFFGEQATTYLPNLSQIQIQLLAIGFISIVTAINYFGIRATGDFEKIVVSLQILLILVLFASLSFWGQPSSPLQSSSISTPSITTAAAAIVGILWSYEGFNCLSFVAHEIQDSSKRLSSYIVTGCAVVMIVYFLLNYLTLRHLSSDELIQAPNIATPLSTLAFGDLGGKFTFAMMMIAVFMTSVPAVLIGPRVTQQMAREGWLPRRLQEIHPRYTSPHIAILAQFVVASLFVFLGNFEWLISCFITISWCFYILVAVGYWRICRKESGKLSSAQFVKLLFFILLALVVIGVQTSRDPLLSLLGGGLLAASFFTARWRLKKLGASEYAR